VSRNLGQTHCEFCMGDVRLVEEPRPITRKDADWYFAMFEGMRVANAECVDCEAKYLAWVDDTALVRNESRHPPPTPETPFFDLSFRSTFNDEHGPADVPKWKVVRHVRTTVEKTPWADIDIAARDHEIADLTARLASQSEQLQGAIDALRDKEVELEQAQGECTRLAKHFDATLAEQLRLRKALEGQFTRINDLSSHVCSLKADLARTTARLIMATARANSWKKLARRLREKRAIVDHDVDEFSHHCPKCNHHNPTMCAVTGQVKKLKAAIEARKAERDVGLALLKRLKAAEVVCEGVKRLYGSFCSDSLIDDALDAWRHAKEETRCPDAATPTPRA